jgi:hypothetical protein
MASGPSIPISQRYNSLVPLSGQKDMEILSQRTVSATSAMSQLSTTSSTGDFVNAKIESITADLAVGDKFKEYFHSAKKRKAFSREEYDDAMQELESEVVQKERELVILKRQKKIISDDIDEVLPHYSTMDRAYSSILTTKIMSATAKQGKKKPYDQCAFGKSVLSFYSATRGDGEGHEKYCHVLGWFNAKDVRCAHIVPKSLESDELGYLYGVREAVISEPRNGMFASYLTLVEHILI